MRIRNRMADFVAETGIKKWYYPNDDYYFWRAPYTVCSLGSNTNHNGRPVRINSYKQIRGLPTMGSPRSP